MPMRGFFLKSKLNLRASWQSAFPLERSCPISKADPEHSPPSVRGGSGRALLVHPSASLPGTGLPLDAFRRGTSTLGTMIRGPKSPRSALFGGRGAFASSCLSLQGYKCSGGLSHREGYKVRLSELIPSSFGLWVPSWGQGELS